MRISVHSYRKKQSFEHHLITVVQKNDLIHTLPSSLVRCSSSLRMQERKGCNKEEILAVLGHELGHWKYRHVLKNLCVVEVSHG